MSESQSRAPDRLPAAPPAGDVLPATPAPPARGEPSPKTHRYVISSATLAEAYAYLTQHRPGAHPEPEYMLAVTGILVDGVRTLERLIEVKMSHQSSVRACFDIQAFMKIALTLYEHGQHLHAVFHSHRFAGPPAPSGTDTRLQGILEEGGYPAIQVVFSEDGWVRFFANDRQFAIEIHGTGAEAIDGQPNTFRIVQFDTLPHPAVAPATRGRGDGLRSLQARAGL